MDEVRRLIVVGLPLAVPGMLHAATSSAEASATEPSTLTITGGVRNKGALSAQALRASPMAIDMEPVALTVRGGEVKRTLTGYRGIRLTDLLDHAVIEPSDHNALKRSYVVARARDDYTVVFSWSELYNTAVGAGVLVLIEKDGNALPDTEGPLALLSRMDLRTGPRHVKWLTSIEVLRA